jgi:PAS domain S-box-containing protein
MLGAVGHDPLILQAGIAIPVTIGLVLYTLMRFDRTPLHLLLVLLLSSLWPWLAAQVVKGVSVDPAIQSLALDVEQLSACLMPALFLLTMGYFARLPMFEAGRSLTVGILSIPVLITIGYLTDGSHHLFFTDRLAAIDARHPEEWAGPMYWAFQMWCGLLDLAALACLGLAIRRGRTGQERNRALLVMAAVLAPVAAHVVFVLGWQPWDFSLAPGALAATALLFVQGVSRHGLLDPQPILRGDVIEHLRDPLILTGTNGDVLDANRAAEAVLGVSRRELAGRPIADVLEILSPVEDPAELGARIGELAPGGSQLSMQVGSRDGRTFELTAAAVPALGSQPGGGFISLRDRTDQRRNEELLRSRQRLESVGILAAGVAHEVNNPLAYMRANLAHVHSLSVDLSKRLGSSDREGAPVETADLIEMPEILDECLQGIDRIGRIVDGLLRFSRSPNEEFSDVAVNRVVEEALRLADLHRDQSVRVESDMAADVPLVRGSQDRLVQLLLNLFLNGKQALSGRAHARIVAETRVEGRFAVLRVRDNGPGIPEADLERIFDPFFTTREPGEGTGLGLSIAFDIAREHGGVLAVDSTLDVGTCFTLQLPVIEEVR